MKNDADCLENIAAQLQQLATRLHQSAVAGEWDRVRQLDGLLARTCERLQRNDDVWHALLATRELVKESHRVAMQLCEAEVQRLENEWRGMRECEHVLRAYEEVAAI